MEEVMSPPELLILVLESWPAIFLTLFSVFPKITDNICPGDSRKIYIRTVEDVSVPPECTIGDTDITKSGYTVINSGNMGTSGIDLGWNVKVPGGVLDYGCQHLLCWYFCGWFCGWYYRDCAIFRDGYFSISGSSMIVELYLGENFRTDMTWMSYFEDARYGYRIMG